MPIPYALASFPADPNPFQAARRLHPSVSACAGRYAGPSWLHEIKFNGLRDDTDIEAGPGKDRRRHIRSPFQTRLRRSSN